MAAGFGVRQPRLDVLAGGTPGIARWQQVDVTRLPMPGRAGIEPSMDAISQRRDVARRSVHAPTSAGEADLEVAESHP
jgi:hypothetical protein